MVSASFKKMFLSLTGFAILSLAQGSSAFAGQSAIAPTIVLVHGAFADGSSWSKVIPLLQEKGLKVIAVQNPLTSLADDTAAVKRVLDVQTGPVVLVGHSWGGAVITEAGSSDHVKALVYVAAFAPSDGQTVTDESVNLAPTPAFKDIAPDAKGFFYLSNDSMINNFAPDVSKEMAAVMTSTQGPASAQLFSDKISVAAWKTKPNFYIVAADDRVIQPELEKALAMKLNAKTTVLNSSHVPMLSQPENVAKVILDAVDSINN